MERADTIKGKNILEVRKDISKDDVWAYISAYHRSLTAEALFNNICYLKAKDIIKLNRCSGYPLICENNKRTEYKEKQTRATIPFQYKIPKEQAGFNKPNAGRFLASLVLSKNYSDQYLPTDLIEAKLFFKENFLGNELEVFKRFCDFHNLQSDQTLSYYKNICDTRLHKTYSPDAGKKGISTIDLIVGTFLNITK